MNPLFKTLAATTLLSGIYMTPTHANTLVIDGTLYKNAIAANGTNFDAWKIKILNTGTFTVDVAAYEASQSSTTAAGYITHDINGDGELTWLDPDTYFYHDDNTINATDAIFRCDDVNNNCNNTSNYLNGNTHTNSPLTRNTHLQTETPLDGSVHFRRDPWYDVTANTTGDYLFLIGQYRLDPAEAEAGNNIGSSSGLNFTPPTNYVNGILDHADYRVTFSSDTLAFNLSGNTITVSQVPVPAAVWLFGSALIGMVGVTRRKAHVMA